MTRPRPWFSRQLIPHLGALYYALRKAAAQRSRPTAPGGSAGR